MQTKTRNDHMPLPPGSMGLPLVGESLELFLDKEFIAKRRAKHGPIFKTHLLGNPTICMVGPEAVSFVLKTHMDHFSWGGGWPATFGKILGNGLIFQDGAEHRKNRQLLLPAFHGRALAGYFNTMETIVKQYLAKWEEQREFTWYDEFKQLTFDVGSQILLGAAEGDEVARLSRLSATMTQGMYAPPLGKHLPTPFGRALRARDKILDHVRSVVQKRQAQPTNDALSLLIESRDEEGNRLSFEEITTQALLLLFASHETTTAMITCACLQLGLHPDVLQRAREEQMALLAQGPISLEQLKSMPYLDQILREVERLNAPGIGGFRGVVKPFEFNGYHVPAGWRVLYSTYGTHRTEAIYADPERFDPDRFSPERAEHKQQAFSLVGFGGGPRMCIGIGFAQMEMKIILAHLLRSYQWDFLPKQRLDVVLFPALHPKDGLQIYFRRWYPERAPAQAPAPERMASPADKAREFAQVFGPAAQRDEADAGQPAAARCPYSGALLG
jgi:cytochrome P450